MDIDWISISPQNGAAGQNPVAFQLVAENETFEDKQLTVRAVCGDKYKDLTLVLKGKTFPIGTVWNFDYTGGVQQITLPKGKYKLQCWGAQGGTSYGSSNGAGSKGGYSEGVITLANTTTLYVFVGGQGSRGSSSSRVNGGWNGGGASVGYSSYSSGGTDGESYPACGGGATDISTVTSSMSYSGGRTNRSSASLLARCIVAGGGAGGSYRYTTTTTTSTSTTTIVSNKIIPFNSETDVYVLYWHRFSASGLVAGNKATFSFSPSGERSYIVGFTDSSNNILTSSNSSKTITIPSGASKILFQVAYNKSSGGTSNMSVPLTVTMQTSTSSTSNSSGYSNKSQQGGGTSGKGQYPGTQSSAGTGGGFGYGANQETTGYRYSAGAGGGGWYGGGTGHSDSSTSYINYSGGGSGFVNTSANASSRPSGYTGLQLDSGTTKDGSTSFESTSGGTETGHSGNGYARITVLSQ